jgi:hypothetical protein
MTPFQAIKATIHMLLAKARGPIQERELAPVPSRARHQRSGATRSGRGHLQMTQTGGRESDSPVQHESFIQRVWKAVIAWVTPPDTGTKR